jgi:hypothetical protein
MFRVSPPTYMLNSHLSHCIPTCHPGQVPELLLLFFCSTVTTGQAMTCLDDVCREKELSQEALSLSLSPTLGYLSPSHIDPHYQVTQSSDILQDSLCPKHRNNKHVERFHKQTTFMQLSP